MLARRLTNSEYNYTVRDLTGVDIRPTREFPVDPSNTAGFDNSGESLVMSPALLKKYLAAAREVSSHLYLHPDGFAFAPHAMSSEPDRDKFNVHRLIDFYRRQNTDYLAYFRAAWRHQHRAALGRPRATLAGAAAEAGVSAKYLATLWDVFEGARETVGPMAGIQARWRALPPPGPKGEDTAAAGREALRNFIVRVRAKIEPRFPNLASGGVNSAQQPFLIWKNVQYATHRMTLRAAPAPDRRREHDAARTSALNRGERRVRPRGDDVRRECAGRSRSVRACRGSGRVRSGLRAVRADLPRHVLHAGARAPLLRHPARIAAATSTPASTA